MGDERGFIRVDVTPSKRGSAIEILNELVRAKPISFIGVYEVPRGSASSEIWVEYTGSQGSSKEAYKIIGEELGKKQLGSALTINRLVPMKAEPKKK